MGGADLCALEGCGCGRGGWGVGSGGAAGV